MDFDLSEEQRILKKTAHDFFAKEYTRDIVTEIEKNEKGYSDDVWRKMAKVGFTGIVFPEEYGGSGGSFLDLVVLAEEMGYQICPSPYLPTVILGGLAILAAGDELQKRTFLSKITMGETILTLALNEPGVCYDSESVNVRALLNKKEYIINGSKLFVPYGSVADYILCVARTKEAQKVGDGLTIFLVNANAEGMKCLPLENLVGDKQCEIIFDEVHVREENILGEVNGAWPIVNDVLEKATLVKCAEMLGGGQAVIDMALSYAKERMQFGRPIGSFQSIQNYLADMWIDINGSWYLVYKAAWKISKGIKADIDVSMAKARLGEVYRRITILGHQIFGGIGFTMEHQMHLYHERSITYDLDFGGSDIHCEKVAVELGL